MNSVAKWIQKFHSKYALYTSSVGYIQTFKSSSRLGLYGISFAKTMLVLHEVYGIFKRRDKVEYSNFLTMSAFPALCYTNTDMLKVIRASRTFQYCFCICFNKKMKILYVFDFISYLWRLRRQSFFNLHITLTRFLIF